MARVKFTHDFDYSPQSGVTIGYLAGTEETVKRECADLAIAKGKAVEIAKPDREIADGEEQIGG